MEEIPVIIVGAGPAGLALGLSLAKYEVHVRHFPLDASPFRQLLNGGQSVILEKEQGITEDPRGVYLAGDAVRILYDIGIRDQMAAIGHGELYIFQGLCKPSLQADNFSFQSA